jgi:hypothetical protein
VKFAEGDRIGGRAEQRKAEQAWRGGRMPGMELI